MASSAQLQSPCKVGLKFSCDCITAQLLPQCWCRCWKHPPINFLHVNFHLKVSILEPDQDINANCGGITGEGFWSALDIWRRRDGTGRGEDGKTGQRMEGVC